MHFGEAPGDELSQVGVRHLGGFQGAESVQETLDPSVKEPAIVGRPEARLAEPREQRVLGLAVDDDLGVLAIEAHEQGRPIGSPAGKGDW